MKAQGFATKNVVPFPEAPLNSVLHFPFRLFYEVGAADGCLGPAPERMYTPSEACGDKAEGDEAV